RRTVIGPRRGRDRRLRPDPAPPRGRARRRHPAGRARHGARARHLPMDLRPRPGPPPHGGHTGGRRRQRLRSGGLPRITVAHVVMTTPTPSKGSATMTVSRYRCLFAAVVLALVIAGGCGGQYSDAQRLAAAGSVGPTSAE